MSGMFVGDVRDPRHVGASLDMFGPLDPVIRCLISPWHQDAAAIHSRASMMEAFGSLCGTMPSVHERSHP